MRQSSSEAPMTILNAGSAAALQPRTMADTGLPLAFLAETVLKQLHVAGDLDLKQLAQYTALSWQVVDAVVTHLRELAALETKRGLNGEMRYGLTQHGRALAVDALNKSAYVGAAPVTLEQYAKVVAAQSVRSVTVTRTALAAAYHDAVIADQFLERLGPAVISGRAMVFYGESGTGKTYLAQRIRRVMNQTILIPHALYVGHQVVRVFDPAVHERVEAPNAQRGLLAQNHDERFVHCRRPAVVVGGELTLDMLDLSYDATTRVYGAPAHVKANGGVFVVDDLGRQRVRPADLLNRWIVPLEERRDFFSLATGGRFELPLDLVLVFSTNLNPLELADDAFLRRLGYKIKFSALTKNAYEALWRRECERAQLAWSDDAFNFLVGELHEREQRAMLPCHARDLIGIVGDACRFNGREPVLTKETINHAWSMYFVAE